MRGPNHSHLPCLLILLLALPLASCGPQGYPDAPPGYDFRTLILKLKYEGQKRGTREIYLETKGYENGELQYKRMADVRNIETDREPNPEEFTTDRGVFFNIEGVHHAVIKEFETVGIIEMEIAALIRAQRLDYWLPVLRYVIRRDDLTAEQRERIQSRLFSITDEELIDLGAKIDEQELMGHKVKRYIVPIADGTAEIWMYGDFTLKYKLESNWRGIEVKNTIEATEFKLNEDLPEKVFSIPEGYKVQDRRKAAEEQ